VTPEAGDYLDKARQTLREARRRRHKPSGRRGPRRLSRSLHAAQAFIFDRTGKISKTHSGARGEFARLAKDDPLIDRAFTAFLAQAYTLKEIADYGVGPDARVTIAEAREAIETAARFVDEMSCLISPPK
jgi:uncharacterized protein (UPF0332 family)